MKNKTLTRRQLGIASSFGMAGLLPTVSSGNSTSSYKSAGDYISVFDCLSPIEIADASKFIGSYDLTEKINRLIQEVKLTGGGVVHFPPGKFALSKLIRRGGVSLLGSGCSSTYIISLKSSAMGLVEIENGPVIGSHLKGIHFLGGVAADRPTNSGQWAMYLHAKWDESYIHGGLWMCDHDDLRFTFFDNGIWSRGGYTNVHYRRPNQFLKFDNVFVQVNTSGTAVRLTGQHGQITFSGGSADARDGLKARLCVELYFDPSPSTTADNSCGHGESTDDRSGIGKAVLAPINVSFGEGFSMQKSEAAAFVRNSRAIQFSGCWVENIGKAFNVTAGSQVSINTCHLANAANGVLFSAPGSGYLLSTGTKSLIDFGTGNNIAGIVDNIFDPLISLNDSYGLNLQSVNTPSKNKFKSTGLKTSSLSSSVINIDCHRFSLVRPSKNENLVLKTLMSSVAPGNVIYLRADSAPLTVGEGGNISLNGLFEITVPIQGVAGFLRIPEVGETTEWILVSVSTHSSNGEPIDGYYYAAGTRIWKLHPMVGDIAGWTCIVAGLAGTTAVFRPIAFSRPDRVTSVPSFPR